MVETGVGGSDQEAGCREQRGRENGMENQKSLEAQLRGDLHHVTRQWESKAMVQGRGAFRLRRRRGGSSGGGGGSTWEGRGLV